MVIRGCDTATLSNLSHLSVRQMQIMSHERKRNNISDRTWGLGVWGCVGLSNTKFQNKEHVLDTATLTPQSLSKFVTQGNLTAKLDWLNIESHQIVPFQSLIEKECPFLSCLCKIVLTFSTCPFLYNFFKMTAISALPSLQH